MAAADRARCGGGARAGAATRPGTGVSRPHVVVLATLGRLGGAERSLVELLAHVDDTLRFTVLLPEDGPLEAAVRATGAACRVVPWPGRIRRLGERARRRRLAGLVAAAASVGILRTRLHAELTRVAPDLVLTNGLKAHVVGALLRPLIDVPLVWYAREGLEDRPVSRRVLRALGRRCDGVIAISRYVASELRPVVPGPAPIHVVRNIVDPARVLPGLALPGDLAKPAGEVWIGIVGALTPLKGQDVFLEAAARITADVPSARFLVVGGEPYATEARLGFGAALRARAAAVGLGARVLFLGERDDAAALIANLDVLVQSNRGPEGLGRTLLEAMACGVPVIGVDRWGHRELVEDGRTGFLVPPGDVVTLADRMRRLASDPRLRTDVAAAARRVFAAQGDPAALAGAFRDALLAIARLPGPVAAGRVQDVVVGGR
jgi:glycosyltransferase involved in cell wall biosynthesis